MKKNVLILASVLMIGMLFGQNLKAQSNKEEIDLYQSIFGMEKKAIVSEFLKLESTDGFWVIYDAYETERKEIGKERIKALTDYTEGYDKLDDAKYDEIIATMMRLQKSNDKLIDTYYKKVKKSNGSKVSAQFYQIEIYFLSTIREKIMSEIPYIGQFDN